MTYGTAETPPIYGEFELSTAPEGAFFVPEEGNYLWANMDFTPLINEQHLFGSKILGTSPESRVRGVIRAIEGIGVPLALGELNSHNAVGVINKLETHFNKSFSGPKSKIQVAKPERDYIVNSIILGVWGELAASNHPVVQAWEAVNLLNQQRIIYNHVGPNIAMHIPVISSMELLQLGRRLVIGLRPKEMRKVFNDRMKVL